MFVNVFNGCNDADKILHLVSSLKMLCTKMSDLLVLSVNLHTEAYSQFPSISTRGRKKTVQSDNSTRKMLRTTLNEGN